MSGAVAPEQATERAAEHARIDEEDRRIAANLASAGLNLWSPVATPREAAEHLIMAYVARGDEVEWLAHGGMGAYSRDWCAQIGGWAERADGRRKQFDCWHILVLDVGGARCYETFPLRAVYDDLHRRMHEGRQLPLFAEVAS